MPAVSKVQQKLMGADLARARAGKKTRTGLSLAELEKFASTPRKGLPARKRARKKSNPGHANKKKVVRKVKKRSRQKRRK